MPRAGLDAATVTAAGADLADEIGLEHLTMSVVADHLGVRAPSLYKHVGGLDDLTRRIAVLAANEVGDALRDAVQGVAGRDALGAAARAFRAFVLEHPGRYAATTVTRPGDDDTVAVAFGRALASLAAVLRGYDLDPAAEIHALRMLRSLLHGFSTLENVGGFQMRTDLEESFDWILDFVHHGLQAGAGR